MVVGRQRGPCIDRVIQHTDRERNEQDNKKRKCPRAGFGHASHYDSPRTASHILQHKDPYASERNTAPEHKAQEPAAKRLLRLEVQTDKPRKKRYPADTESDGPQSFDLCRCVVSTAIGHYLPPPAGVLVGAGVCCVFEFIFKISSGLWLTWSVRIYATTAHLSAAESTEE